MYFMASYFFLLLCLQFILVTPFGHDASFAKFEGVIDPSILQKISIEANFYLVINIFIKAAISTLLLSWIMKKLERQSEPELQIAFILTAAIKIVLFYLEIPSKIFEFPKGDIYPLLTSEISSSSLALLLLGELNKFFKFMYFTLLQIAFQYIFFFLGPLILLSLIVLFLEAFSPCLESRTNRTRLLIMRLHWENS